MQITGTHFNYYYVCHRKLWLFANGINMEHTSDLVAEGKLIHENSYPFRSEKYTEIELDGIKIDYYDTRNQVVHEVKKSKSQEKAHEWQVKYYLYVLKQNGVENPTGILEYPKLRKTLPIELSADDDKIIKSMITEIKELTESNDCPPVINSSKCKKCSYFDFCYSGEIES
ncbi:CRISPR-associated protein Cas4 [Alkalitalea saponilacus]|uniref:CRISPR-associated exonuclease Cas4 n=1 Tax=Alkalitalea saponilacus TaxID=889453 RepID=A0A1T5HU26_9BACT|nr:CRISPR-associated protein Cas4 [Alkalitalea saponilacus]ASB49520.1 CRISPR-associated protein Cas4 [Alkalitalea saponilacus]SKC24162.1 CRISPR-associated exonuclease Cas4 [Alkalitalea saponilacus]